MSGASACVMGGKSMYVFAGHHDGGPSSTVSLVKNAAFFPLLTCIYALESIFLSDRLYLIRSGKILLS